MNVSEIVSTLNRIEILSHWNFSNAAFRPSNNSSEEAGFDFVFSANIQTAGSLTDYAPAHFFSKRMSQAIEDAFRGKYSNIGVEIGLDRNRQTTLFLYLA